MNTWLLLQYRVPGQPSALRVYVWRKLKRLHALLLNDALWVLPGTPRTVEQFQWLADEIREMHGEASLWRSTLLLGMPEKALVAKFNEQVDVEYKELLRQLGRKRADLMELSRTYQQIAEGDYFHSDLGAKVKQRLLDLAGETK